MKKHQKKNHKSLIQITNNFNIKNNFIKIDSNINEKQPKIKKHKGILAKIFELPSSDYKTPHQIIKGQKHPIQSKPHFPPKTEDNTQKHKEKKEFKLKCSSKYYSYPLENDENGYFCTYIHNEFRTDTTRISLIVNTDIDDITQYTVRIKKRITDQLLLKATLYKNEVEIENLHFKDPNIIHKDLIKYKETAHT